MIMKTDKLIRETTKAVAVYTVSRRLVWLPKSQIVISNKTDSLNIEMPDWLWERNFAKGRQGGIKQ